MEARKALFAKLNALGIASQTFEHIPVFTCDEALKIKGDLPPHGPIKNLFLKDKKKRYWLVVALHETKIQLKELAKALQAPELRFAGPDELLARMGLTPGSVTPLGLINDKEHVINVVLDQEIFKQDKIGVHPLSNDATSIMTPEDLEKFIVDCGNEFRVVDFAALAPLP